MQMWTSGRWDLKTCYNTLPGFEPFLNKSYSYIENLDMDFG